GRISHGCLGLYSDDCEAALARVIAHCRRYGTAKLGIQLAHAGRKASARRPWEGGQPLGSGEDAWQTIAPSVLPFGADWPLPLDMPLGARITGNDWVEGGLTPDDAAAFARALKAAGVDFVCISSGGISAEARPTLVANTNVQFAEKVKREAGIVTRTVGLIAAPKQAEAIVAEGKADMVALA